MKNLNFSVRSIFEEEGVSRIPKSADKTYFLK